MFLKYDITKVDDCILNWGVGICHEALGRWDIER